MDEKDVILAKYGDAEAIEKVFLRYKTNILRNSKSLFIKGGDIDDLLQEGYIGLMKAIKSYDQSREVCFSTFANLCIKRQIITAVKSSNSNKNQKLNTSIIGDKEVNLDDLAQYSKPSLTFYSPEDILLGKELVGELGEFLNKTLTPLEKKVFLYTCKQYRYNEIAEILNEPSKKIDNAIQRVRKKVLGYLAEYTKG
ncbi:sigma-70 family RNA polymerase sigma factor [Candidatus Cetobacterium colombiensis]|jgi:RNA polymerase sporulation-specific sigma factor|uniref:Sigma-70 family RNA polymerase sigma factor n=1 Tax=Candidatus Cetobacterium colombiensis TaxID=3073100 RepID=A0ABU4W8X7_9FUSO|nr:sigma-70 family RNA polymerase sigma factor [Candidatus Cetobacterium colombiensis]MDX8335982.1 sigma-70 family RNA polymerase sigma factor [Candidatus Cetobacterium colombiensis]